MSARAAGAVVGASLLLAVALFTLDDARLTASVIAAGVVAACLIGLLVLRRSERIGGRLEAGQVRRHRKLVAQNGRIAKRTLQTQQRLAALRQWEDQRLQQIEARIVAVQHQTAPARSTPAPLTGHDLTSFGAQRVPALRFDGPSPSVVLTLHGFGPDQVFAGVRTALVAAAETAAQLSLPLRVVVLTPATGTRDECLGVLARTLEDTGHADLVAGLRLSIEGARDDEGHHPDDVWLATFWTTADMLGDLVLAGRVRRDRVVYLVQDWEPSFYPWGDLHARALGTYGLGFAMLVNSRPLARYLGDQTGCPVDPRIVFAPEIEAAPVREASARWAPGAPGEVRLLFYARPSKPRNMLNLGLQAIRMWADGLPDHLTPVVRLAGEQLGPVDLGPRAQVEVLGKTSYEDYYALLARTDLGLALMNSPHPGHLALELPMAGIPTLTNAFHDYREPWVEGLALAAPHPRALAEELRTMTAEGRTTHTPGRLVRDLGGSLPDAVAVVVERLRTTAG